MSNSENKPGVNQFNADSHKGSGTPRHENLQGFQLHTLTPNTAKWLLETAGEFRYVTVLFEDGAEIYYANKNISKHIEIYRQALAAHGVTFEQRTQAIPVDCGELVADGDGLLQFARGEMGDTLDPLANELDPEKKHDSMKNPDKSDVVVHFNDKAITLTAARAIATQIDPLVDVYCPEHPEI